MLYVCLLLYLAPVDDCVVLQPLEVHPWLAQLHFQVVRPVVAQMIINALCGDFWDKTPVCVSDLLLLKRSDKPIFRVTVLDG